MTPTDRLIAACQRVLDNATDDDPRISEFDWQELRTATETAREEIVGDAAPSDDPSLDATDGAHPAWWRGSDHTAKMMQRQLAERLGAPLDTCWQKLLDDVEARRAAAPAATALGATDETPTERCFEQARALFADMRERGAFVQEHGQDALVYHLALLLKRTEEAGARAERARCEATVRLVPLEWLRAAGMQDDASHDRCRAVFITALETMPGATALGREEG